MNLIYRLLVISMCVLFPNDIVLAQKLVFNDHEITTNPILSVDGQTLYFARHDHSSNLGLANHTDIWFSNRNGAKWNAPVHLPPPINSFSKDHPVMFGLGSNISWTVQDNELKRFEKYGRRWSEHENLIAVNLPDSIQVISDWSISLDERTIAFCGSTSSQDPADIYISQKLANGIWTPPFLLEAPINLASHESSVFLSADGQTLYFSSDRFGGFGGQDIYITHATSNSKTKWSKPENLGPVINSPANDQHFHVSSSGNLAVYDSDRNGTHQIFEITLPQKVQPNPTTLLTCHIPSEFSRRDINITYFLAHNPKKIFSIPFQDQTSHTEILLKKGNSYVFSLQHPYKAFSNSLLVDLTPHGYEPVDIPLIDKENTLNKNSEYQGRESIIKQLQKEIHILQQIIQNTTNLITKQENQFTNLAFPSETIRLPNQYGKNMNDIRNKYQKKRQEQESKEQPPFASNISFADPFAKNPVHSSIAPLTSESRINELKELYTFRRDSGYVTFNPLSEKLLDSLSPLNVQTINFDDFQEHMIARIQAEQLLDVLEEVKRRGIAHALQETEDFITKTEMIIFHRDRPQLEKQLLDKVISIPIPDTSEIPALANWQMETALELNEVFLTSVKQALRLVLIPLLEDYYQRLLSLFIKEERKNILQNSLNQQITFQLASESSIAETLQNEQALKNQTNIIPIPNELSISLPLLNPQQNFELAAVLFEHNTSTFLPIAFGDLDRVILFLNQNPELGITIKVHTHTKLSHSYALALSNDRAETLKKYLEGSGISANRIKTIGIGKMIPTNFSGSIMDDRKNQRVEVSYFNLEGF
ncbi:MAG: OmpA family protein [Saprospiraceae bacterium]|nr:OmpA family protein [Saprospiraceae bacterium]